MDKQTFYFTFGCSSKEQPYDGGWAEVTADSMEDAVNIFNSEFPPDRGLVRCAGIYTELEFRATIMGIKNSNFGRACVLKLPEE